MDLNICLCGKCKKLFDFNTEAKVKTRALLGRTITEKTCPYCGSLGYSPLAEMEYLSKFDKTNDIYD